MVNLRARVAVFEALKASAPSGFNRELRYLFLNEGADFDLADLDMDGLAIMNFVSRSS